MNNKVFITIGSILAIVVFLVVAYKLTNVQTPVSFPEVSQIQKNDHLKWSPAKKNVLVEYGDLQCPACQTYYTFIKNDIETTDIPKKVTFVYRHFPLSNTHIHADEAAQAAEAASLQGKFFEYANFLFENQKDWETEGEKTSYFEKVAKNLKLDLEKFKKDKDSKEVQDRINVDIVSANKFQVNQTPTFYLNGQKLDSLRSYAEFKKLLSDLK